jgi:3-hydroxybutyryl-CoA dehydrogenase
MGSGIAQIFAQHGFKVILYDVDLQVLHAAKSRISRDFQVLVEKNKITNEQKAHIVSSIRFTSELNECVADFVIEAVIEKEDVKTSLLNSIADINNTSTVFATNTSSLSVNRIAEKFLRPSHLAGMHFFNPPTLMKLVEVIKTDHSKTETIDFITNAARMIGKTVVLCKDSPGFIVNRVARPYYLESLYLAEKHYADIQKIDSMLEATGFRMGPFKLMDLIGNDINYSVSCIVHEALGNPERLKPSALQALKVKEGLLGRKSGKGYYEYPGS